MQGRGKHQTVNDGVIRMLVFRDDAVEFRRPGSHRRNRHTGQRGDYDDDCSQPVHGYLTMAGSPRHRAVCTRWPKVLLLPTAHGGHHLDGHVGCFESLVGVVGTGAVGGLLHVFDGEHAKADGNERF